MTLSESERQFVRRARVARLATVTGDGAPHAVPVCYALVDGAVVSPLDEKPKAVEATELRRVRNVRADPRVTLLVDHYAENWDELGWVQIRGTAELRQPNDDGHEPAVRALREKYDQYVDQAIESRPVLRVSPGTVVSWGNLSARESV
ncbi:TIGR03668 family PPOX class F420-dependent oxidoreductase [Halostella pelagica]|uniref:TIGR03668 family PPOX class F420-dependent oxidoreductase n=1 Tax=Halostella pelagica TaxID=2583824 RepID=UPI0010815576|nr:TIGR03668 family PPOX class F420-dependent oxidoreductase [Halostella pelagica]